MLAKILNTRLRSKYKSLIKLCARENSVWTSDKVVKSPFKDVEIPNLTVDEYTWMNLDKWATKTAVVCGVTNRSYTYEQLYKKSRVLAANIRKKFKVKDGDTVAIILPNSPEYAIAAFGIVAAGGIASTLNPIYTAYETQKLLQLSEASLIITNGDIVPVVREALKQAKKDVPIICTDFDHNLPEGTASFKELIDDVHVDLSVLKEVSRKHEDVAFLPFSSGTTGMPKGVQLTNRNIVSNSAQQDTDMRLYEYTTETHQDGLIVILPMFHIYALTMCMMHKLSVGLKMVTLPRFKPETFINTLLEHRTHLLYLAPPMILFMGSHPGVTSKHVESLRSVISGAAPIAFADTKRFLDKAKHEIHFSQAYGMTEASPLVTMSPLGFKCYKQVGFPVPNIELRIINDDLKSVGPGEVGELIIKGPNVMKGYWKNPEANSGVFFEGDWLRSGDLGSIDENGLVTIADRLKELIKVKGFQVPPAELEGVIKEHPAVLDAAVIGVPDQATGERPKAFVVLKQDAKASEENIMDFVSEKVSPYKKLKEVVFLDSIPKNPSGKILKKVLREQFK